MKFILKVLVFFLYIFSLQAQNNEWIPLQKAKSYEIDWYKKKNEEYEKKQLLDSSYYLRLKLNKHLKTKNNVKSYIFNLHKIFDLSQNTYHNKEAIIYLKEGVRFLINIQLLVSDTLKGVIAQELSEFYFNLSLLYESLSSKNLALEYALKHLRTEKQLHGVSNTKIISAYNLVGTAYNSQGNNELALLYYQKALDLIDNSNNIKQNRKRIILNNIGNVYVDLKDIPTALKFYEQIFKMSIGDASNYMNIADAYKRMGLHDLATEKYTVSLNLRRKQHGEKHPFLANIYNQLAEIFIIQKKNGKALKAYQKALSSNLQNFNDTINVYALPKKINLSYHKSILLKTLLSKASLLIQLSPQKANLEQAYKTYQLADKLVDKMRKNLLRKSDELRLTSTVASMYENVLQACWRLSKYESKTTLKVIDELENKTQVPNEEILTKRYNPYWVKAFYFAEKGKSSVLRKLATDASAKIQSNIPEVVLEQERKLNGAILYYQRQLDRLQLKKKLANKDSTQKQLFENQRFELRRKYDQLLRDLEEKYPDYYDLKHNSYIAKVDDVQRRLDAKTALIEYAITDKHLYSFVITREGFHMCEQTIDKEKLKKEITRWLNNIRGGSDDSYLARGHRFFKQFIEPLKAQIKGKKHLLIIPDGLLSRLPFEAIITQKDVPIGKPETYPYLIRKWGVTLYPSASLALMQHKRRNLPYTQDFLGLAPVFEKNYKGGFRKELNALPFTKKEVEAIHQLFQSQQKTSKVITGTSVTEQMVKELKGHYKFIHFATHGFLEDKMPVLAFYPGKQVDSLQPQTNDGALSLEEIFNLKFKADMVVLSSCQGGAGKNVKGEGILAITRGFVYLGTPHIIYTLWSVNDKDAAELMIRFYRNMSKGKSYREALRLAKLSMLGSAKTAWPRWWAGFTMMSKMK